MRCGYELAKKLYLAWPGNDIPPPGDPVFEKMVRNYAKKNGRNIPDDVKAVLIEVIEANEYAT